MGFSRSFCKHFLKRPEIPSIFFMPCHENLGKYGSLLVAWRQCLDEHASGKSGLPRRFSWLLVLVVVIGGGGFGCLLLCSFPLPLK